MHEIVHNSGCAIGDEQLQSFLSHRINSSHRLDDTLRDALDELAQFESPNDLRSLGFDVYCKLHEGSGSLQPFYELTICPRNNESEVISKVFIRASDGMYVFQGERIALSISDLVDRCTTCLTELTTSIGLSIAYDNLLYAIQTPEDEFVSFEDTDSELADQLLSIMHDEVSLLDEDQLHKIAFQLMEILISPRQHAHLSLFSAAAVGGTSSDPLFQQEIEHYANKGLEGCTVEELRRILVDFDGRAIISELASHQAFMYPESRWAAAKIKYELP